MSMRKAFLALLLAASVTPALAQDKTVNLKVSLWVPPAHPLVPATQAWAADIEKASGGTIKIAVFPSEQLGKAFDHYDMARDGIADVTYVNPGYQPGRFPIAAAGQLPFVFADGKKGTLALNEWYHKYAPTEMKDTKLCFAFIHDPGALHGKKKILVPGDLKGVKVRPAQSTIGEMVKMFGGTNVQASAPESRDAIERGVADEITFPWGSMFLFGIDKVVKYTWTCRSTDGVHLQHQSRQVQLDVACAEEGHRRSLHAGMGLQGHRSLDRFRGQRPRQDEGAGRPRGL